MKSATILKVGFYTFLLSTLSLTVFKAHGTDFKVVQTNDMIITIDHKTSDKDLNDIKAMLEEHDITATFSKVKRNENKALIGICITLEDGNGSKTISEFSSNQPISKLTFGMKDGNLFINQGDKPNDMASFNFPNIVLGFPNDSIFGHSMRSFNFQDFFGDGNDSIFLNGRTDIQKLMERMQQGFNHVEPKHSGKYKFIDNPNLDKLIIIDGKEGDFEKLNSLAKADKLTDVEVLSPKIAMSIYGDKAKDGAIVAITKK